MTVSNDQYIKWNVLFTLNVKDRKKGIQSREGGGKVFQCIHEINLEPKLYSTTLGVYAIFIIEERTVTTADAFQTALTFLLRNSDYNI